MEQEHLSVESESYVPTTAEALMEILRRWPIIVGLSAVVGLAGLLYGVAQPRPTFFAKAVKIYSELRR